MNLKGLNTQKTNLISIKIIHIYFLPFMDKFACLHKLLVNILYFFNFYWFYKMLPLILNVYSFY